MGNIFLLCVADCSVKQKGKHRVCMRAAQCVREPLPCQLCTDNYLITVFNGAHFEIAQSV